MKLAVIALSTAALIASAPAALSQGISSQTPNLDMQKHVKKAGHRASHYASGNRLQAYRRKTGYPGAFGYTPNEIRDITDISTQAGGGGGGGGGGGM
jgi:hypothetical protein